MTSKGDDYVNNEYYAYNLRLFRLIGLWDYQRSTMKFTYVCFINLLLIIAVFEQIYTVVTSDRDLNSIAKLLETTLPTLCFGLCYYNLLSNGAIMKKILYRMHYDWDELAGKPELMILEKYAKLSRLCTVLFMVSFYLYIGFLLFPSFLRIVQYVFGIITYNELILPVRFDNYMKNHISYSLGFCHQCLYLSIACTIGIANYSMFVSIILRACALFNVVVWRINERFRDNRNSVYPKIVNDKLLDENEWIVDIIEFHRTVIEFVDLMKLFYEGANLKEGIFAILIMMIDYFYVFQVLSLNINKTEKLTKFFYVIGSMMLIFAYFYLGQKLIDHHNNLFLTLRQIPFYTLTLKAQKIILFLTLRSTNTCNLSWKGAIVVSHNLFAVFIQKTLSFAMILYSLD